MSEFKGMKETVEKIQRKSFQAGLKLGREENRRQIKELKADNVKLRVKIKKKKWGGPNYWASPIELLLK